MDALLFISGVWAGFVLGLFVAVLWAPVGDDQKRRKP